MMSDENIDRVLYGLSKSKFRSSFKLRDKEIKYIESKGLEKIEEHTYDFINKRLAPEILLNDGKQTPMGGHPSFIAQHATATCCRGCLYKWHHIGKNKKLSEEEVDYVVAVIMSWIRGQMELYECNIKK